MFSRFSVANYEQVMAVLDHYVDGAHRMNRAQIDRSHRLSFSINGTTWCELDDTGFRRRYALDDSRIPLAEWAVRQPSSSILVLAYRPGKRLVLKDLTRGRVIKGYKEGKSSGPAECHRIATTALMGVADVSVARMLCHDQNRSSIEMAFCPSPAMRIVPDSDFYMERIGAAIGRIQEAVANATALAIPRWNTADELQTLLNWRSKLEAVGIVVPQIWVSTFDRLASQVPESQGPVLTHRDLHDGQWLRSPSELCLLDFDSLCVAHPLLDLGNFAAHIDLRYLQSARSGVASEAAKQRRLLQGYARHASTDLSDLSWFRSASLLRLGLVYAIRPRWRHLTDQLVARAAALVCQGSSRGL